MHLFNRDELLNVFFHKIPGCFENIWSFSTRGPRDRSNKASGYHFILELVYMHRHSVCLYVQVCVNGKENKSSAKVIIHIFLTHFDFCSFYKVLFSINSEKLLSVCFFESTTILTSD
ncbi:hypothetical protein XENOCAPTIV_019114 [Xenoophorus captivus]|uniref:Uncharacterized protein n=1 Tax=Xenoophorus captivus TaxID=1517983 RepID=A0ABV0QM88_9TELE